MRLIDCPIIGGNLGKTFEPSANGGERFDNIDIEGDPADHTAQFGIEMLPRPSSWTPGATTRVDVEYNLGRQFSTLSASFQINRASNCPWPWAVQTFSIYADGTLIGEVRIAQGERAQTVRFNLRDHTPTKQNANTLRIVSTVANQVTGRNPGGSARLEPIYFCADGYIGEPRLSR